MNRMSFGCLSGVFSFGLLCSPPALASYVNNCVLVGDVLDDLVVSDVVNSITSSILDLESP